MCGKTGPSQTEKIIKLNQSGYIYRVEFSPDTRKLALANYIQDSTLLIDLESGVLLHRFPGWIRNCKSNFSPDGRCNSNFSPDGRKLVTITEDGKSYIWDVNSGILINCFKKENTFSEIYFADFSPDSRQFVVAFADKTILIWDVETGALIQKIGYIGWFSDLNFNTNLITTIEGSLVHFYSLESGRQLYSLALLSKSDYLILHQDGYYDGTEAARNLLYFVCNSEIIDLAQMKDALYVPGLVEKIMTGQEINYPKLSELDICDALPIVKKLEKKEYTYTITPRRLPLERAEVYVNDKLIFSYPVDQLSFIGDNYVLELDENELEKHLLVGEKNRVKVIGVVKSEKGSELRTRGITEPIEKKSKGEVVPPRLFAVMIGVNDYKDPCLRLNYEVAGSTWTVLDR